MSELMVEAEGEFSLHQDSLCFKGVLKDVTFLNTFIVTYTKVELIFSYIHTLYLCTMNKEYVYIVLYIYIVYTYRYIYKSKGIGHYG